MWMKHLIILWLQKKQTLIIGLSQAENLANRLNQNEGEYTDQKWIAMPVHEYIDNI